MTLYDISTDAEGKGGWVKNSKQSVRLYRAVKKTKPGDQIRLGEGTYLYGGLALTSVALGGIGSYERTVVLGGDHRFEGASSLTNCTLDCTGHNKPGRAFTVSGQGAVVQVHSVQVKHDKMNTTTSTPDVVVERGATLWVYHSFLGRVLVDGGVLYAHPSSGFADLTFINGGSGSWLTETEAQTPTPTSAPPHISNDGQTEHADDEQKRLRSQERRKAARNEIRAVARDRLHGVQRSESAEPDRQLGPITPEELGVGVDRYPRRREIPADAIRWSQQDSRDWDGAVRPNLKNGGTVVLENGEYWVPQLNLGDITIMGIGDPSKTVVHIIEKHISIAAGHSLRIENLTLNPAYEEPVIIMESGRTLHLSNVIIDHLRGAADGITSLAIAAGSATLEKCEIRGDRHQVRGGVEVSGGAQVSVKHSKLGWVGAGRGRVDLTACSVHGIVGASEADVRITGGFWISATTVDAYSQITATTGAQIHAEHVTAAGESITMLAAGDARVRINKLTLPHGARAIVKVEDQAAVEVFSGDTDRIDWECEEQSAASDRPDETPEEAISRLFAELESLTGLAPVKDWVHDLVEEVKFDRRRGSVSGADRPTYHMAFTGNPGTGKTTVARIVGELFYNLGILPRRTVKEVGPEDLRGEYRGQSAPKVDAVIDEAMGGVIFIDEAYSIVTDSDDSVGKEAVATLLTRLENDRDKFIAIVAGYTESMNGLYRVNPGIKSRIPNSIEFPDYSPEEIGTIVVGTLKGKSFNCNEGLVAQVAADMYMELPEEDRSNARWARIFAEQVIRKHKRYCNERNVSDQALSFIQDEVIAEIDRPHERSR